MDLSELSNWNTSKCILILWVRERECEYLCDTVWVSDGNAMPFKNTFHFVAFVAWYFVSFSLFYFDVSSVFFWQASWHESKSGFYYSINSSACPKTHNFRLSLSLSPFLLSQYKCTQKCIQWFVRVVTATKSHYRFRRMEAMVCWCNIVNKIWTSSPLNWNHSQIWRHTIHCCLFYYKCCPNRIKIFHFLCIRFLFDFSAHSTNGW